MAQKNQKKKPTQSKATAVKPKKYSPAKSSAHPQKKSTGRKGFQKKKRFDEILDLKFSDKELGEMDRIKRKLAEIRQYKQILAEDGLKPDSEDKARESELIVRLLRIEKNAKMAARQKAKAEKTAKFREAEAQEAFAREKKKARQDRYED